MPCLQAPSRGCGHADVNSAYYDKNARGSFFTFLGNARRMPQHGLLYLSINQETMKAHGVSPCPRSAADACILPVLLFGQGKAFFAVRAPKPGLARKDSCIIYSESSNSRSAWFCYARGFSERGLHYVIRVSPPPQIGDLAITCVYLATRVLRITSGRYLGTRHTETGGPCELIVTIASKCQHTALAGAVSPDRRHRHRTAAVCR